MGLEKSPSLDAYVEGIPSLPPATPARHRWLWAIIGIMLIAVAVLIGVILLRTDVVRMLGGTGTVSGWVVDEIYRPIVADIYIQKTNLHIQTDANGHFEMRDVPAGQQSVVVAYRGSARGYPVTVIANRTADLGQICFLPRPLPQ